MLCLQNIAWLILQCAACVCQSVIHCIHQTLNTVSCMLCRPNSAHKSLCTSIIIKHPPTITHLSGNINLVPHSLYLFSFSLSFCPSRRFSFGHQLCLHLNPESHSTPLHNSHFFLAVIWKKENSKHIIEWRKKKYTWNPLAFEFSPCADTYLLFFFNPHSQSSCLCATVGSLITCRLRYSNYRNWNNCYFYKCFFFLSIFLL